MMGMRKTDLGELYALLEMYQRVYGGVPEELLIKIENRYEKTQGSGAARENQITNPRGAGRKSKITEERIRQAKELKEKGYKIREIGKEMGCSAGHVHKLINERLEKK